MNSIDEPPSIEVQLVALSQYQPTPGDIQLWATVALESNQQGLTIRVVEEQEIVTLNQQYRNQNKATNVLSFPSDYPQELNIPYLGDIAVCANVVNCEAVEQKKQPDAHWAHMVIHGILHLRGYDHIDDNDAKIMETLEIKLLKELKIDNPYYV